MTLPVVLGRQYSTSTERYNCMTIEQLTNEFELARPQLKSYILRITASIEDTEDIAQDSFIKASQRIDTFRGDSSVKTWIDDDDVCVM
jgi:hypothetical protein